jgi:hypothetical protein
MTLRLTKMNNICKDSAESSIIILPNMEYNITYYNPDVGALYSITGLVEEVYEDQIKVKYLRNIVQKENVNKNNNTSSCSCMLNPPDTSKYDNQTILFIPIMNIVSVTHVEVEVNKPSKNNGGIHVMLLGISATMVKAIVIKLAFFNDNIEEAIKYVDLEVDNIYDLAYESNGTIFESRVKIVSIEEVIGDNHPCKPGKGYVREHIGCHNSVYTDHEDCSKSNFMQSPPVKKVKIVVDTSETFSGRYETIMLDRIRDCKLIGVDENVDTDIGSNNSNSNNCNCMHDKPTKYHYEDACTSATLIGGNVELCINGEKSTITVDDMIKYYLGIQ